jgi:hypothetical protein
MKAYSAEGNALDACLLRQPPVVYLALGEGGGARAPTTTANPMKLPTILEQTIKDEETEVEEAHGLTSPLQLHPQLHQLGGALQVLVHLHRALHRTREITQGVRHRVRCGVRRVAHQ